MSVRYKSRETGRHKKVWLIRSKETPEVHERQRGGKRSMEVSGNEPEDKGALSGFTALLKTRSRRNRQMPGGVFSVEGISGEQFSESFGKGMFAYLAGPGSNVCPPNDFPAGFLQELAIAYAIGPDYGEEAERELLAGRAYAARVFDIPAEEGQPF